MRSLLSECDSTVQKRLSVTVRLKTLIGAPLLISILRIPVIPHVDVPSHSKQQYYNF